MKHLSLAIALAVLVSPAYAASDRYVIHVTEMDLAGKVRGTSTIETSGPTVQSLPKLEMPYISGIKDGRTITDKVAVGMRHSFAVTKSRGKARLEAETTFTSVKGFSKASMGNQRGYLMLPIMQTESYGTVSRLDGGKREWRLQQSYPKQDTKISLRVERVPAR